jgi:PAS domain S-box-containing protein
MRLFFERQLVGMAITSPEKGWVKVNDKICEMLGYPREELTQLTWSEMTYPDDLAQDVSQFERLLRDEIEGYTMEKRFIRKDGSLIFTNLAVGCVRRPDRTVNYVLAILEDITGRKQADNQIRRLNEQLATHAQSLEQANKELEAFSYSVSHDLRAPLRSIDGFSQILLDEYQEKIDEQGKDYLRRVRFATQRMAQLIDDMLNLSRVSRGEMNIQEVNISRMVQEITDDLQGIQPERKVEFIIQEGIKVRGDGRLLRIVLENLIGNAWKFTSKHPAAVIEFGMQQQNERPVYFIRDNGAGFNMEYAQKLFGAFQRLHAASEFPGTGVGLATVQRVIHRHGGKVWAEGEVEKGATFYFTI